MSFLWDILIQGKSNIELILDWGFTVEKGEDMLAKVLLFPNSKLIKLFFSLLALSINGAYQWTTNELFWNWKKNSVKSPQVLCLSSQSLDIIADDEKPNVTLIM